MYAYALNKNAQLVYFFFKKKQQQKSETYMNDLNF